MACARLRLLKLGDKSGLSVSLYGEVKAGDLAVVCLWESLLLREKSFVR